jgi:hypothetical protein
LRGLPGDKLSVATYAAALRAMELSVSSTGHTGMTELAEWTCATGIGIAVLLLWLLLLSLFRALLK